MKVETLQEFVDKRPRQLCKMCGKCCRVVTASVSYYELQKMALEGDKEAIDFLELFVPFESVEAAMRIDKELVENIPDYRNRTFYTCRYLTGNLCSRYNDRLDVCKRFPSSPWAVVPPECGYYNWLLEERENIINHVKGLKEEKLKYKRMLNTNPELKEKLEKLIEKIDMIIKIYAPYGSEKW